MSQSVRELKAARRLIFTDSVMDIKSVAHLLPKDTCVFPMPRAALLQMGTALEVLEKNGFLLDHQQVMFIIGPDQLRDFKRKVIPRTAISEKTQQEFVFWISEFIQAVREKREVGSWTQLVVCFPPWLPDYDSSQQEVFCYAAEFINASVQL